MSLVVLASCGGGNGDDFAADANSICVESERAVNSAVNRLGTPQSAEEAVKLDEAILPVVRRNFERLRALDPPEEDADAWKDYLAAKQDQLAANEDLLAADRKADLNAARAAQKKAAIARDESRGIAADLGLEDCAAQLPSDDEEEITETVDLFFTSNDWDRICRDLATKSYVELSGGLKKCLEPAPEKDLADSVKVTKLTGVSGIDAVAEVTPTGGRFGGKSQTLEFSYEDGTYKIDFFGPTAP